MRRCAVLVLALLVACEPCGPGSLSVSGEPPQLADAVLAVAAEHAATVCPKAVPFRGHVTWFDGDVQCGPVRASGCSLGNSCAMHIAVLRVNPATISPLAHEIGHHLSDVCSLGWDEYQANAFAEAVNREAWVRWGITDRPRG